MLLGSSLLEAVHKHVGEIDPRCQFHQRFTSTFFVQKFVLSQNVTRKKAFIRKIRVFHVGEIDSSTRKIVSESDLCPVTISNLVFELGRSQNLICQKQDCVNWGECLFRFLNNH